MEAIGSSRRGARSQGDQIGQGGRRVGAEDGRKETGGAREVVQSRQARPHQAGHAAGRTVSCDHPPGESQLLEAGRRLRQEVLGFLEVGGGGIRGTHKKNSRSRAVWLGLRSD